MFSLLRRNRDIRFLFGAQVVSYLGDWFTFVALAGLIDDLTGSKFLVSLVLVSLTLPSFLMSPVAGSFADRFDRRRIIFVVSIAQAIAALGFLLVDKHTVWLAFVCQSTISALAAFIGPSSGAAIPNLVDNDQDLRYANSLFGSTWGIMLAVGAGLGGIFSSAFGRNASFIADALTFVIAAFLVSRIRRPMQAERTQVSSRRVRPLADMGEAITLARHNK
ncbi:MAG: MFS transporter, partial [Actinobacteria bacterium]|nr:MFS transporter [Actinomycetota bacterium]